MPVPHIWVGSHRGRAMLRSGTKLRRPSNPAVEVATYHTGTVRTIEKHGPYGYFLCRSKIPEGQGIWPSFWLTNDDDGEIDAMEVLGGDPTRLHCTVHGIRTGQTEKSQEGFTIVNSANDLDPAVWNKTYVWGAHTATGSLAYADALNTLCSSGSLDLHTEHRSYEGKSWVTGALTSVGTFTYGYYEARMKFPVGVGFTSALDLITTSGSQYIGAAKVYGSNTSELHFAAYNGTTHSTTPHADTADLTAAYHVIGVDWQAGYVRWYYDDVLVREITTNIPTAAMHLALYSLVDYGTENIDETTPDSAHFLIDYVRRYATKGGTMTFEATFPGTTTFTSWAAATHEWGVDWQPTYLRYYVDDVLVAEYTGDMMPQLDKAQWVVLMTSVGITGAWGGGPDDTTVFPCVHDIEWVREYDTKGGTLRFSDEFTGTELDTDVWTPELPWGGYITTYLPPFDEPVTVGGGKLTIHTVSDSG